MNARLKTTNETIVMLKFHYDSIERKRRMPHIRDIKGEAVVVYCEPLITKEIGYYRLSRRANKNEKK